MFHMLWLPQEMRDFRKRVPATEVLMLHCLQCSKNQHKMLVHTTSPIPTEGRRNLLRWCSCSLPGPQVELERQEGGEEKQKMLTGRENDSDIPYHIILHHCATYSKWAKSSDNKQLSQRDPFWKTHRKVLLQKFWNHTWDYLYRQNLIG